MPPTTYRRRAGYAAHISVDRLRNGSRADAHVLGKVLPAAGAAAELVFIGLFRDPIPEGQPARWRC